MRIFECWREFAKMAKLQGVSEVSPSFFFFFLNDPTVFFLGK